MNFIRKTPPRPMLSGGTITNPLGHRPTQSLPFPMYGVGGSPVGGRGPPGEVTGQEPSERLGPAELVLVEPPIPEPPDGVVAELPTEQPAVPTTRHEIRNALRTSRSLVDFPTRDSTQGRLRPQVPDRSRYDEARSGSWCLTQPGRGLGRARLLSGVRCGHALAGVTSRLRRPWSTGYRVRFKAFQTSSAGHRRAHSTGALG